MGVCTALAAIALLAAAAPVQAQEVYELGTDDEWTLVESPQASSIAAQLASARTLLAQGRPERAYNLAVRWIKRYPTAPELAGAYLVKGDALVAMGDLYESLYDFEYIARKYPGSPEFAMALEREYTIAEQFATGTRRKWLGMRIASAVDEAEEILIRIQERMPGSQLAEQAGLALAALYFRQRRMNLAAEAYAIFIEKYPRSPHRAMARRRLIYANIAAFKGPQFDIVGLLEAKAELQQLQVQRPVEAEQIGANALISRIEESQATKLLNTAKWYDRVGDPVAAERTLRALVRHFPRSTATAKGLAWAPALLAELPVVVRDRAPDYALLRKVLTTTGPIVTVPTEGSP
jgi:outer membrane protein assembly factor BamD (BamD/ComL family)